MDILGRVSGYIVRKYGWVEVNNKGEFGYQRNGESEDKGVLLYQKKNISLILSLVYEGNVQKWWKCENRIKRAQVHFHSISPSL